MITTPSTNGKNGIATPPASPLDRRHDVLCISSIDWDFIWQGHQEIMSTLAAQGHRVLFLENTGVRSPKFSDLPRLRQRLRNFWKGTGGFREERPNLFVFSPIVLPLPYSRIARWLNRVWLVHSIRRWMRAVGFARPVVWTFLPTPLAHELIGHLDPALTIYYCIDDLASSSPEARRITSSEVAMFQKADLVFVTSEKLRERAAQASSHVYFFPFGVRFHSFEEARLAPREAPADIAQLERPIVGYVGGMHQWIDQDLVVDVARRLPHVTFAFVGPEQCDVSRLQACANVTLLGGKAHSSLPGYIREFDVGIVPYRLSDYTSNVYPTKLNEYLSMGIPVVATDLLEIRRFNADHGDVVAIAPSAEAFAAAIERTLTAPQAGHVARRIEVAKTNSWQSRIAKMSALIDEAAGNRSRAEGRWELRLKRAYRLARRRTAAIVAALAVTYMVLFQTPIAWELADPLEISEPPQPADVIVVFAGGVGESGQAGGGYQERVKRAVDLYRDGYAPRMIFSSGFVFAFEEAEVMRGLAMANGVPPEAILLETNATNTYENVALCNKILLANGWKRILLVSSPYHMRRAVMTWRRSAPGIQVTATPVAVSQFYIRDGAPSFEQLRGLLQEYAAIALYWWRGWA
ncbi:MAG: ElyC/SanA/YdcF family protein [Acidobacteriota bacterium]|nr:ElyC/SanA/YdcF family protein [Acidobacteriota bacterium]